MTVLVVDACVRGAESATRRLYEAWLSKAYPPETRRAGSGLTIETLYLTEEPLVPFTAEMTARRSGLTAQGCYDDPLFRWAKQFAAADEIIIGAPYWDWSFPSILKVYIEHVSVSGIAFIYRGPEPTGLCKAKRIRYFSTCGGFTHGHHEGVAYIRAVAQAFGIPQVIEYTVEGLDTVPGTREQVLSEGIARLAD